MYSARAFVSMADSDDDDYVSMSEGEVEVGIQAQAELMDQQYFEDSDMSADEADAGDLTPPGTPPARESGRFYVSGHRRRGSFGSDDDLDDSFEEIRRPPPSRRPQKKKAPRGRRLIASRDEDEVLEERQQRLDLMAQKRQQRAPDRQRRRKKVNTNIISVDLSTLAADANQIATGDPYTCKTCGAILSSMEELKTEGEDFKTDEGEFMWVCQFCSTRNVIDIEEEERPQGESQDYMIEPPNADEAKSAEGGLTIFCVDVSGSMCVTKEVTGKFKLKGDRTTSLQSLNVNGEDQFFVNQSRNSTWISRLQAVQAAVDQQIENIAATRPEYQVGLVTFSNEVTIIGDGTSATEVVAGDKLSNTEALRTTGANYQFQQTIRDSKDDLVDRLWKLEENGATALGPALVVSIAMAARRPGSNVIVCTDGLANVGVGSLDGLVTDEEQEAMILWYEQLGEWALEHGVVVNVVSITDDDCRLENLGRITEKTRGDVKRLDPLKLTKQFRGLVDNQLIATHCTATMFLHPGLVFTSSLERDDEELLEVPQIQASSAMAPIEEAAAAEEPPLEEAAEVAIAESEPAFQSVTRVEDVGNVFADTKVFFEFLVNKEKREQFAHLDSMPFQVQIGYKRLDGAKMMRVITQTRAVSKEKISDEDIDINILSEHTTNVTAHLCRRGSYEAARMVGLANVVYMDRNAKNADQVRAFNKHMKKNVKLDRAMQRAKVAEAESGFDAAPRDDLRQRRQYQRNDQFSEMMYDNLM